MKKGTSETRKKLREKIEEKRIQRNTKEAKEKVLDQTLKSMGIDRKKLQEDLEKVKKEGGLTTVLTQKTPPPT